MTLDYNVEKIPQARAAKNEKIELLGQFMASGKPCAKVNLFGKSPRSVATGFNLAIKERKLPVNCLVSGGEVYLVRRSGNV